MKQSDDLIPMGRKRERRAESRGKVTKHPQASPHTWPPGAALSLSHLQTQTTQHGKWNPMFNLSELES